VDFFHLQERNYAEVLSLLNYEILRRPIKTVTLAEAAKAAHESWKEAELRESEAPKCPPHRLVGAGDYGGSEVGTMCGDCGIDAGDI